MATTYQPYGARPVISADDMTRVIRGMERIYLDFNATTPIAPEVAAAMRPLLEAARSQVAELIGAAPDEIVLTSGGSEANNLAIKGAFFAQQERGAHIVTTAIEHPATLAPCRFLERLGGSVTVLPVDGTGLVDPDDVRRAITARTVLIPDSPDGLASGQTPALISAGRSGF
jgi:cysteine desulfurase